MITALTHRHIERSFAFYCFAQNCMVAGGQKIKEAQFLAPLLLDNFLPQLLVLIRFAFIYFIVFANTEKINTRS